VNWLGKHKVRSGALQFAVFIAVLIALLLSGLMLYAYTFGFVKEQSTAAVENIQLAGTAIDYALAHDLPENDTLSLPIVEKEHQTVKIFASQWGMFQKIVAIAQHRQKLFRKVAIIGSTSDLETPALFLQENYSPLALVGNTVIRGIACLPSQGVKPGYIAGEGYYGSQLIDGPVRQSARELPKLDPAYKVRLLSYLKKDGDSQYFLDRSAPKTVNSFLLPTKSLVSHAPVVLEDIELIGNIIIKSDTLVRIRRTAKLRDIIIVAPNIEIEAGTSGNFQAIASKSIVVGEDCRLDYPSALALLRNNLEPVPQQPTHAMPGQITVKQRTTISGSICVFQHKDIQEFTTQLFLDKQTSLKGQVYCEGNFALEGSVTGSAYVRQFIANKSGTVFLNHIYNGTIENKSNPYPFGGILFEDRKKTILQWLF